ncbi:TIGR03086 family protein [Actinomadura sp. GC306]|uniref:TIGR03086 family metal-binding protein n=1 Tax=Actinomadura sp. GC306 TaxID=2530367 RepID=UPI00104571B9|nr:TIGR03086 family metal-binding protein [Actinomadura sp. GC306]TDC66606.1 TIGR03086 family protein [Actinomadura sp. GC306]
MTAKPDLTPAARRMSELLAGVRDDRLAAPTPCPDMPLGALIDHIAGLSLAFTWAAAKRFPDGPSQPPSADAANLPPDWRARVPERLDALAAAWRAPEAWEGTTQAGGIDMSGEEAGHVAMNELVVHGWDLARATGRPYDAGKDEIETCLAFVGPAVEQSGGQGIEGLFGPAVEISGAAPALDQLMAKTGRDPSWTAS